MLIDDAHLNLQPESHLYAQNIAADLLHAYLNNMLMIVNQSMTNLASVNPTDVNRTLEASTVQEITYKPFETVTKQN